MNTTTKYDNTITYEEFNKPLHITKEEHINLLLDWRLHLMQWKSNPTAQKNLLTINTELEATDTLLSTL